MNSIKSDNAYPFFIERLRRHAQEKPDQLAVQVDNITCKYGQLLTRGERIAAKLRAEGCEPGDRIVVIGRPSMPWVEIMIGAISARCAFVPLSTALTESEKNLLLEDTGSTLIFSDKEFMPRSVVKGRQTILLSELDEWLSLGAVDNFEKNDCLEPKADDLFSIIYSSGTTGVPKGIAHTNAARSDFIGARPRPGFGSGRVALICTSLYTNFSFLGILTPLYYGAAVAIMSRFTVEGFLKAVAEQSITDISLVPVQVKRILEDAHYSPKIMHNLKFAMVSGSPVSLEIKQRLVDEWPGRIVDSYGTTETGGIATLSLKDDQHKLDSVGKIMPGVDAAILDDEGNLLDSGQIGEIAACTPLPMSGYYNRDDLTQSLCWEDGRGTHYINTGDVGFIDEEGYLHITGRSKDMIISGGLNIYASDIEGVLADHPDVDESAVIAVPDDHWGETPYAMVVLRNQSSVSAEELLAWLAPKLARTSCPAGLEIVPSLPRNDMGKVLKRQLREPFWKDKVRGVA